MDLITGAGLLYKRIQRALAHKQNKKQSANRFNHNLNQKSNHTQTIHIHEPNQEKKKQNKKVIIISLKINVHQRHMKLILYRFPSPFLDNNLSDAFANVRQVE